MQPTEIIFDPHVSIAITCLGGALLVSIVLATLLLCDWLGIEPPKE